MIWTNGVVINNRISRLFVAGIFAFAVIIAQAAAMLPANAAQPYGTIVYSQARNGSSHKIFTSSTAGSGEVDLGSGEYPSFSLDGSKIVFVDESSSIGWRSEIYVMNKDGTDRVRITTNGTPYEHKKSYPKFSPDGTKIIFVEQDADLEDRRSVRIVNAIGTGLETVKTGSEEQPLQLTLPILGNHPSFSPDGTNIVYNGDEDMNVYTFDIEDGGVPTTVVSNEFRNLYPSFSPDGSKIVYFAYHPSNGGVDGANNIYTVNAAGGSPTRLTNFTGTGVYVPTYSPDGSRIVFLYGDSFWSVTPSGSGLTELPYLANAGDGYQGARTVQFLPGTIRVTSVAVVGGKDTLTVTENLSTQDFLLVDKTLIVGQGGTVGTVGVGSNSILKGVGTVGALVISSGGKLAPGMSPGCITAGNTTLSSGSTFEIELGGTTQCTEYDQLEVTGTVNLNNATLQISFYNNFVPSAKGDSFIIVKNDGNDAITGTFNGLPEGAEFTQAGYVFQITYTGGDGNDVVITAIEEEGAGEGSGAPGAPNTGLAAFLTSPVTLMAITIICAGSIYVLSRHRVFGARQ